jgi:hypothetical protein
VRIVKYKSRKYYYQSDLVKIFGGGFKAFVPTSIKVRCVSSGNSQIRYLVNVCDWRQYNKDFKPHPKEEIAAVKEAKAKIKPKAKVSKAVVAERCITTSKIAEDLFDLDFTTTTAKKAHSTSTDNAPEVKIKPTVSGPTEQTFQIAKAVIPPPKVALTRKEIVDRLTKHYNTAVLDDVEFTLVNKEITNRIKDYIWKKAAVKGSTMSRDAVFDTDPSRRQAYLDLYAAFETKLINDLNLRQKDIHGVGLDRFNKSKRFNISVNDKGLMHVFREVAIDLFPLPVDLIKY